MRLYESLFDRPDGPAEEREHIADNLSKIKILMESIERHSGELAKFADRALDILYADP